MPDEEDITIQQFMFYLELAWLFLLLWWAHFVISIGPKWSLNI